MSLPVLLVFSHLRWGFVYQRPQHLMSRLAGRWRVLFVEEPVRSDGPARLEEQAIGPHLSVLVPHTPVAAAGFHDDQLALLQPLLASHLCAQRLQVDVAWLYTPMAVPLLATAAPRCVVYDCMDELSAFKDAPRQLRQRESALLKSAALVLTGGPSLYESRRGQHPHVVCLPSAVDAAHFAPQALLRDPDQAAQASALMHALPRPRLGYFGVIDERLDIALLAALADSRPDWSVVMVGPVVKIDPAGLPRRANLHWLGMQPYERLPHLLGLWDLCLMPFALNEATRFISPTKTLEYMAGGKPVVSTAVRDVISLYGQAVMVADGADDFIHACERLLLESGAAQLRRQRTMQDLVARYSWDRSADTVHALIEAALRQAALAAATATSATPAAATDLPRVAAGGGSRL